MYLQLLFLLLMSCSSQEQEQEQEDSSGIFGLGLPRDGDAVLLVCTTSVCNFNVELLWYVQGVTSTAREYSASFQFVIMGGTKGLDLGSRVELNMTVYKDPVEDWVGEYVYHGMTSSSAASYLVLYCFVEDVTTGKRVHQLKRTILFVTESDLPTTRVMRSFDIKSDIKSKSVSDRRIQQKLPFIEIGTSNFNSCIQMLQKLNLSQLFLELEHKGISMEAIQQYLVQLPDIAGVKKLHAAIIADSNGPPAVPVYHMTESLIEKLHLHRDYKGCSRIGSIHPVIRDLFLQRSLPFSLVRKEYVPTFTMQQLIREHVETHSLSINLLKLDLEGLDIAIVRSVLNYYNQYEAGGGDGGSVSVKATRDWPCVIHFETNILVHGTESEIIRNDLNQLGYKTIEFKADTTAVNCLCGREDLKLAFLLLNVDLIIIDENGEKAGQDIEKSIEILLELYCSEQLDIHINH